MSCPVVSTVALAGVLLLSIVVARRSAQVVSSTSTISVRTKRRTDTMRNSKTKGMNDRLRSAQTLRHKRAGVRKADREKSKLEGAKRCTTDVTPANESRGGGAGSEK